MAEVTAGNNADLLETAEIRSLIAKLELAVGTSEGQITHEIEANRK